MWDSRLFAILSRTPAMHYLMHFFSWKCLNVQSTSSICQEKPSAVFSLIWWLTHWLLIDLSPKFFSSYARSPGHAEFFIYSVLVYLKKFVQNRWDRDIWTNVTIYGKRTTANLDRKNEQPILRNTADFNHVINKNLHIIRCNYNIFILRFWLQIRLYFYF